MIEPEWLSVGEVVLESSRAQYRYQKDGSMIRRSHRANFFLTDRRIVATGFRGRRLIHIPFDRISLFEQTDALVGRASYWRMLKPILRVVVDEDPRTQTNLGVAVPNAQDWVGHLERLVPHYRER